jgi:hypothetical protein
MKREIFLRNTGWAFSSCLRIFSESILGTKLKYPLKIVIPKIPDELSLFWASLFGEVPPKINSALERLYFEPLEIQVVDFQPDKLLETMAGNILFPRRISQQRLLNSQNRSGFRRDAYVYFLDATRVEDIVDFWNLRALGRQVLPVPKQLKDNPQLRRLVTDFLKVHRRPWPHNPSVCDVATILRARGCTMDEVTEYAKSLKIEPVQDDTSKDSFFSLQHWYPRVWDQWARDKDGAVPDDVYGEEEDSIEINETKELKFRFQPLLPKFAQKHIYHGEPRCANEISFRFYGSEEYLAEVLPKSSGEALTRAISGLTSLRSDWRVGRNGLVKLVKDSFTQTREIPSAQNIMFAWLQDLGWKPKISPPGLLAKQIYRKFEGHPMALRNEKLLGLIEHMNGGTVKHDGRPAEENKIKQERELSVGEVKNKLEASQKGRDLYSYLLSKGVFKLGLRMQCSSCLRNSWFPLEVVENTFTCPKCLESFLAVGNLDAATWCYKTAGPFSVPNYADGAYAVLLSLEFFSDHYIHTIRTTPVLSFTAEAPDKKRIEADFALFWEESIFGENRDGLLFGECKTYTHFTDDDFGRMQYLAKTFPGAVLVFCTLRKVLSKREIAGLTRVAKAGRKYWKSERPINPVLILTGTELLNYPGPPHCWPDPDKEKFNRMFGLLDFCDATQQIYLKLPSWQTEWHDKWQKRYQRRATRLEGPL